MIVDDYCARPSARLRAAEDAPAHNLWGR
jgi:hypothetical protein